MEHPTFVYTTWPSADDAEAAARELVGKGLCACANIIPGMTSIYEWKGTLERAAEVVMILKTQPRCVADLMAAVESRHPYDVPAITAFQSTDAESRFADWIVMQTGGPSAT
ncbi:divalent-cation tolerance protein CutA [Terrihabitans rhizophilus]|uniref:Divalent-cation tolerance protein CutA n=1 Tax=Terrihabitans rhizophilus TaxID=3092662 RepID=A0ABU4RRV4_9HYPH|nr:divalent-cation tolerance protein CutA [Terrihabitans sp. PJ23]MDX6807592.1 divalent-cation tolerance protein CutA [Terrihabitans sp. PJ23]